MLIICTLITFVFWAVSEVFCKKGNSDNENYNHLKTGIVIGFMMFVHAVLFILFGNVDISLFSIIKYLPVSLCYIAAMLISYKGLKYLRLSLASPIQNTSGIITSLLLIAFFHEKMSFSFYLALVLVAIGLIILFINLKDNDGKKKKIRFAIIYPLIFCLLDGIGVFLDGIYLDKLKIIDASSALVSYELTFFIYAVCSCIFLKIKKEKFTFLADENKILAALFETLGEFTYIYAVSKDSIFVAPVVSSSCIFALILSHIFLKEKLSKREYLAISFVIIGIIILSLATL